jgi:hypothetical protein
MEKLMLMKKLNNKSGKSIFMALFLLLVCVVVSVVIVTVAVTSVMHVEDNHTAQQDYLACSSAAELIKDSLAGGMFTSKLITEWKTDPISSYYSSKKYTETITESNAKPVETLSVSNMKEFFSDISRTIVDDIDTWDSTKTENLKNGTFKVEMDGMPTVEVDYKLLTDVTDNHYNMRLKLVVPEDEDSYGYVMNMKIPIIKVVNGPDKDGNNSKQVECQGYTNSRNSTSYHESSEYIWGSGWTTSRDTHTFYAYVKTTTITWGAATDSSLSISKGSEDYDSAG